MHKRCTSVNQSEMWKSPDDVNVGLIPETDQYSMLDEAVHWGIHILKSVLKSGPV